jgi:predicted acyl esterase
VARRWWDRWLKGVANGVEDDPRYRVWMMDSAPPDASAAFRPGVWVAEPALPGRSVPQAMALGAGGVLGGSGDAAAVIDSPQDIGLEAGEFFPMGLNAEMAGDQQADDARSATFDTAPLGAPLAILGGARLRLRLTSDAPRAHLVARLCDVAPDGRSVKIAHGILNLCHRDDMHAPTDVPVGTPFDAVLVLDQCAYRLAAGHRLRLALSNTCWPFVWPARDRARLTVLAGGLDLPVHPGAAGNECTFDAPPPLPPESFRRLGGDRAARRIERDLLSGAMALVVEDVSGEVEHAHGLIVADSTHERWSVHPGDPLSARADLCWTQSHRRGERHLTTEVTVTMTCTAADFRMEASLVARENGAEVMRRDWDDRVARIWA